MAETLLIHTLIIDIALENAARDSEQLTQFVVMQEAAKQDRVDLEALS